MQGGFGDEADGCSAVRGSWYGDLRRPGCRCQDEFGANRGSGQSGEGKERLSEATEEAAKECKEVDQKGPEAVEEATPKDQLEGKTAAGEWVFA